jgi:hypothetical protein
MGPGGWQEGLLDDVPLISNTISIVVLRNHVTMGKSQQWKPQPF